MPAVTNTFTNLADTIISTAAIEAFTAALAPLRAFSLNASPDPVQRGDKVKVLFVDSAAAALDFDKATGYTIQASTAEGLDISLNRHKFVSWGVNDTDLSQNPQLELERFGRQKGFQLAKAVFQDILSVVTLANYGAAAFTGAASTFDSDDVADIALACDLSNMPASERSLIIAAAYFNGLRKDDALKGTMGLENSAVLSEGRVPRVSGFDVYMSTIIPGNSENLVGFAVHPDAILVAMRYLAPQEGNSYFQATAIADPNGSGLTIGLRDWYDNDAGERRKIFECVYGFRKGNGNALKRLTSA